MPDRREILARSALGIGGMALSALLADEARSSPDRAIAPLAPRSPHFAPKAKRVIHLFMNGGPSHVDTFDPKPLLTKNHGKALPRPNLPTERKTGSAFASPFKFSKHGQSGLEISELFPYVSRMADHLCVVRSMHADVPNHEPSLLLLNCGDSRLVRPSMGSWVTYGLGSENQNLPGLPRSASRAKPSLLPHTRLKAASRTRGASAPSSRGDTAHARFVLPLKPLPLFIRKKPRKPAHLAQV